MLLLFSAHIVLCMLYSAGGRLKYACLIVSGGTLHWVGESSAAPWPLTGWYATAYHGRLELGSCTYNILSEAS